MEEVVEDDVEVVCVDVVVGLVIVDVVVEVGWVEKVWVDVEVASVVVLVSISSGIIKYSKGQKICMQFFLKEYSSRKYIHSH